MIKVEEVPVGEIDTNVVAVRNGTRLGMLYHACRKTKSMFEVDRHYDPFKQQWYTFHRTRMIHQRDVTLIGATIDTWRKIRQVEYQFEDLIEDVRGRMVRDVEPIKARYKLAIDELERRREAAIDEILESAKGKV